MTLLHLINNWALDNNNMIELPCERTKLEL